MDYNRGYGQNEGRRKSIDQGCIMGWPDIETSVMVKVDRYRRDIDEH